MRLDLRQYVIAVLLIGGLVEMIYGATKMRGVHLVSGWMMMSSALLLHSFSGDETWKIG